MLLPRSFHSSTFIAALLSVAACTEPVSVSHSSAFYYLLINKNFSVLIIGFAKCFDVNIFVVHYIFFRDVAQPGSASRSGRGGRWFESSHPD